MKTTALAILVAFGTAASACAAVDFTPLTAEFVLAGIKAKLLNFKQDGRTISYGPPAGWILSGGSAGLKFTPPEFAQAHAVIEQSPLQAPQPLNEEVMKALQAKTLASVPAESRNVTLVSEEQSPVRLGGNDSYAATVAYEAFGQEFMASVLYVNLPDTQLRFRTLARKADFEKVHNAFRGSVFSWHWK